MQEGWPRDRLHNSLIFLPYFFFKIPFCFQGNRKGVFSLINEKAVWRMGQFCVENDQRGNYSKAPLPHNSSISLPRLLLLVAKVIQTQPYVTSTLATSLFMTFSVLRRYSFTIPLQFSCLGEQNVSSTLCNALFVRLLTMLFSWYVLMLLMKLRHWIIWFFSLCLYYSTSLNVWMERLLLMLKWTCLESFQREMWSKDAARQPLNSLEFPVSAWEDLCLMKNYHAIF